MPTYEYKCLACKGEFEALQPITANPLTKCNLCGSGPVERVISSGGGLLFKGSGFYITDYRSSSYRRDAGKDKSDTAKPAASDKAAPVAPKPSTPSSD